MSFKDSRFTENTADVGGVIYIKDRVSFSSHNCTYERNFARVGGVIYAQSLEQSELAIRDFIFTENQANESGHVAFMIACQNVTIENGTFI